MTIANTERRTSVFASLYESKYLSDKLIYIQIVFQIRARKEQFLSFSLCSFLFYLDFPFYYLPWSQLKQLHFHLFADLPNHLDFLSSLLHDDPLFISFTGWMPKLKSKIVSDRRHHFSVSKPITRRFQCNNLSHKT